MASQWVDVRDLKFILHEVFKIDEQILGKGPFADYDGDTVDMVLDSAAKLAENEIAPTYPDEVHGRPIEAVFKDGKVYVQAGAGIVADSDPEREYCESLKKAEALINTLKSL